MENTISDVWKEYNETKDPALREQLILEYAPIVKYVAGRLSLHLGQHMDFDDLTSYGIFGLIDAIEKFDMLKGVKFETYASLRIRGAIIDNIRNMDWIPRTLRQKNKSLDKIYSQLESELGREPTEEEIAKKLSISVDDVRILMRDSALLSLVSLDDYIEQNNDVKVESGEYSPEGYVNNQELRETLIKAIEDLNEKERLVVTLHYYEELTLREISKILKVSESRISQIHTKALLKMQGKLGRHKFILFADT